MAPINKFNIKNPIDADYKDEEPPLKKSRIYKVNCKQCEKVYIGQRKRNLETRTKDHFRNLRLYHSEKSAIASHFWNTGHEIDNSANLLKTVNRKNELIICEKIFIHKHAHHIINFEVPPESSLIKKYICRTPDSAWMHQSASPQCMMQHFSRIELRMGKTSSKTIVFRKAN